MKSFLVLNIIICCFLFSSMNCSKNGKIQNNIGQIDTIESINWSIGKSDSSEYKYLTRIATGLSLDQIQKGYNGLEVRIWFEYKTNLRHLLIIKLSADSSVIYLYNRENSEDSAAAYQKLSATVYKSTNKENVFDIVNKLLQLGLFTLPSFDSLPDAEALIDPVYYIVEIAVKDKYRFYDYPAPEHFKDKYWQCLKLVNILEYLETTLNFKRNLK